MVDRLVAVVGQQVLLADIGDVAALRVFGEEMVEGLVLRRTDRLGNGVVPFLAVGKFGIDIEYYAGRGVYQLTVTGVKPYTNMEVSLSHEAYNGRPAYWRTVVVGCVKNGLLMPLASPYYVTMNLDQFVGSRGVEIVGASRKVRRAVPRS